MTRAEKWHILGQILAFTVPMGTLIGVTLGWLIGGSGGRSLTTGAFIGLLITVGMVGFEVSWAVGLISRRWRETPFLVVLVTRSLVWLMIIVAAISLPLLTVGQISWDELADQTFIVAVVGSFVAALLFNFVGQVNRLLGRRVLVRLILGRYHRPREEVRAFLLIDLRNSTEIAERLGNLRYHAFVKRFIGDVTAGALRHRGEVHRYVGDEVILTWTAEEALRGAACVETVFAVADAIEVANTEYMADFGVVPSFWSGLHLGPVVTGEIGTVKHEIAYLGDTLNATARIEQACKQFHSQFLASAEVIDALDLPEDITTESLGPIELRGIGESLELFAVTRTTTRQRRP